MTQLKILLIDDDRIQFRIAQAQLAEFRSGTYELEWAETYEEGLKRLQSGVYMACLLDYRLGDRDGLQLIREAVSLGCRTPIVFLTADTSESVDIEAMNAGALDYLVKGEISPRVLERSLRYAVKLGESIEALRQLATHDELTGLLNRREFHRILAEEEERALRFGHSLGLIIVDIDRFKSINDTHGHPAGDVVLREIARRLGGFIRNVDRIARLGGEEFVLLLLQTDANEAAAMADKLRKLVEKEPVRVDDLLLPVTISAGSAALPGGASTGTALVAIADRALYSAKAQGRNRAVAAPSLPVP